MVFIRCDGGAKMRLGCSRVHEAHDVLHSHGLNKDHAKIVAENWSGRAVNERTR
jgi:hypothetical protein